MAAVAKPPVQLSGEVTDRHKKKGYGQGSYHQCQETSPSPLVTSRADSSQLDWPPPWRVPDRRPPRSQQHGTLGGTQSLTGVSRSSFMR